MGVDVFRLVFQMAVSSVNPFYVLLVKENTLWTMVPMVVKAAVMLLMMVRGA